MIVYRAKACLHCDTPEEIRLISLSNEPGFGYVTAAGEILVKADTMTAASAKLQLRYPQLTEVDSRPYWQDTA